MLRLLKEAFNYSVPEVTVKDMLRMDLRRRIVCLFDAICKTEPYDLRKGSYSQSHCLEGGNTF